MAGGSGEVIERWVNENGGQVPVGCSDRQVVPAPPSQPIWRGPAALGRPAAGRHDAESPPPAPVPRNGVEAARCAWLR